MNIEAGKYYRTRGGQVFGPMTRDADPNVVFPWCVGPPSGVCSWTEEGAWSDAESCHLFDLVSEAYVSDTPPAPRVNTAKTARDELVEKAALEIFKRFYLTPASEVGFDWMWRAAENFVGGGTEEMTEEERAQRDAYLRDAMMGADQKPSLEARLDWLEADASAQRTAILRLERDNRWHRMVLWVLSGFVYLGILWRLFL